MYAHASVGSRDHCQVQVSRFHYAEDLAAVTDEVNNLAEDADAFLLVDFHEKHFLASGSLVCGLWAGRNCFAVCPTSGDDLATFEEWIPVARVSPRWSRFYRRMCSGDHSALMSRALLTVVQEKSAGCFHVSAAASNLLK